MADLPKTLGLRHVALYVIDLEACSKFYQEVLQMQVAWQPDEDNLYLTTGFDNFALHRAKPDFELSAHQRLDHFGFFLKTSADVDIWHDYLKDKAEIKAAPKNHRDGTRSFYVADPEGNVIQFIHYPDVAR